MPVGQRLCLSCGKLAVQFEHASEALPVDQRRKLVLRKAKEEGERRYLHQGIAQRAFERRFNLVDFMQPPIRDAIIGCNIVLLMPISCQNRMQHQSSGIPAFLCWQGFPENLKRPI